MLERKFAALGVDSAPGQEVRLSGQQDGKAWRGPELEGIPVDFSHGDVDAFPPPPAARALFMNGVRRGGAQAYTEYRGAQDLRETVAARLAEFTGAPVDAANGLIITPGTQGALFLAMAATVAPGGKIAVVEPDYFANRKLVRFFDGELVPVRLDYAAEPGSQRIDLDRLERAFACGTRALVFSNPNNPVGAVYSRTEIEEIARLASACGATVIVDQLYSRLIYDRVQYTHLRALSGSPENLITIMGPSKTESLSGYRLGVAFGSRPLIERMEKLQAIVSLRAAGYNQAVLGAWFDEPDGWMTARRSAHQAIRDDLVTRLAAVGGVSVRAPEGGSYLFPKLPELAVSNSEFVTILREQGRVIVTPGAEFAPDHGSSVRLNFSQDATAAGAAVDRMAELIERYRR